MVETNTETHKATAFNAIIVSLCILHFDKVINE